MPVEGKLIEDVEIPSESCNDKNCPYHGNLSVRLKTRVGIVVSTGMTKTCTVEIRSLRYIPKYKRYMRVRSKIHAHVPDCIKISVGDTVKIAECRRLAKTVSHVVLGRVISHG